MSTSSANGTKSSPVYDRNAYVAEELSRTQKELSKQSSEILALKNQLGLNQVMFNLIIGLSTFKRIFAKKNFTYEHILKWPLT